MVKSFKHTRNKSYRTKYVFLFMFIILRTQLLIEIIYREADTPVYLRSAQ